MKSLHINFENLNENATHPVRLANEIESREPTSSDRIFSLVILSYLAVRERLSRKQKGAIAIQYNEYLKFVARTTVFSILFYLFFLIVSIQSLFQNSLSFSLSLSFLSLSVFLLIYFKVFLFLSFFLLMYHLARFSIEL